MSAIDSENGKAENGCWHMEIEERLKKKKLDLFNKSIVWSVLLKETQEQNFSTKKSQVFLPGFTSRDGALIIGSFC